MGATLEEVGRRVTFLRQDREHGSTFLARYALETLALAAAAFPDGPGLARHLARHLARVGQDLARARPAMAAVKNVVACFLDRFMSTERDEAAALGLCERIMERLAQASEAVAVRGAELLPASGVVLTCSYSSTVVRTCTHASQTGKLLRVVALESRWRGIAYGRKVADELSAAGVPARVVADAELPAAVSACRLALVGADKVLPDGSLINGAPTLALARAVQGRALLYAVCESFKFDDDAEIEEGFERVPGELVTGFVTEAGTVSPAQLRSGTRVRFLL